MKTTQNNGNWLCFYQLFMDDWYIQVYGYHRSVSYCEHFMFNKDGGLFQQNRYENLELMIV